ncbi:hypothetical protein IY885_00805 [Campylobacter volucris]|nr:hypothetical protein [Campylobacter volucris]
MSSRKTWRFNYFFQHYKNIEEAIKKWNYRKDKITAKKYIIMNYINYDTYSCHKDFKEIITMFKNISYEKKFFYTLLKI